MKSKAFFLIILIMLVPASMLLVSSPTQAQASDSSTTTSNPKPTVKVINGGTHDIPLKAIKNADGNINVQNDFEIEPQNVVTISQPSKDFHVIPSAGSLFAVKITDEQRKTTDMQFSKSDGRVTPALASKAYLLDIIIEMDNGDKYLYETVLAVLAPGQTLNQVNTQNIIQNFVSSSSSSSSHTTVVFRDDNDNDNGEEPSICYFEPNDAPECEPVDGECPNGWPMNEQGNCHPGGKCPDGFERVDDDESGTCFNTDETFHCPTSGAIVLDPDDCAIYDPGLLPNELTNNETSDTPEDQSSTSDNETQGSDTESGDVVNDEEQTEAEEEPLDSNCGGVPCTASEKEDSWTSDVPESSPGVPIESDSGEETPAAEEEESGDTDGSGDDEESRATEEEPEPEQEQEQTEEEPDEEDN